MIRIADLQFRYPASPFSLEMAELLVGEQEKVALVGPSGSGKTTLLQLIAGILVAQQGSVSVLGQELRRMSDAARRAFRISRLGLVFQDFELLDYLNTEENILLEYFIHGSLKLTNEVRGRAHELARRTGVEELLHRPIRQLSHGERQRVAICRAMMTKPDLILADEPTANLDPGNKQQIVQLLTEYADTAPASLVVVTHDTEIVSHFDRTLEL